MDSKLFKTIIASAVLHVLVAPAAWSHGGYDEELQRVSEQIAAAPDDPKLWYQRSYIHYLHGDWVQALLDAEKTDRLAPGKFLTDYIRGQALASSGRLEVGRSVLDHFIQDHPGYSQGWAARARIQLQLKKQDAALDDFRMALLRAKNPEPDLYQEVAEALTTSHHEGEAVKVLQEGIAKLGDIPALVLKALDLEIAAGKFDAALTRIDAMQKTAPRPEPWMARRAALLAQAGRADDARAAWTALRDRIQTLPNLERGSHAMSVIFEQATQALNGVPPPAAPPVTSSPSSSIASSPPPLGIPRP